MLFTIHVTSYYVDYYTKQLLLLMSLLLLYQTTSFVVINTVKLRLYHGNDNYLVVYYNSKSRTICNCY